ncbi:ribonuclease H2 catalytic subunit RNH201 KNAG_0M01960 [Huiozyma naganishii CBS 8797]|uniref:Ribonuclease n=1 Tax=Huiozyma naganishii (strain ATCC MYA-139 / BCRC 22969 / CBS 8797 / KCTC 17520 / NBRC 10181 / NCYC 3082 / Yp74L-3) TaxID=1071383 RepID=J7SAU2_HUIN7|nr:hypothetical protein KNAG_0M01960 [Kazachstania naganishii CBS 8797]CCK73049.1 hypothetical protein KNAG_0M01960 [Kazachstania naganishii CBS 8797]
MLPPTVQESIGSLHSTSFFSAVPDRLLEADDNDPVILGVDEAGRGPVVGPMVYGVAYCKRSYEEDFIKRNYEFDDSKKLTDPVRRSLFEKMYGSAEISELGYATTVITATDISSGMSRFPPSKQYNLNEQAHNVTMDLIQGCLDRGVKLHHVYVDTVGPPVSYQKKLEDRFPQQRFTVTKKADSLFCVVSVASVVAKVTRDILVESLGYADIGSGYPSDPRTKQWLRDHQMDLFGWPNHVVRFSWQTCRTLLEGNPHGVQIQWEEDFISTKKTMHKQWELQQLRDMDDPRSITLDNWYKRD